MQIQAAIPATTFLPAGAVQGRTQREPAQDSRPADESKAPAQAKLNKEGQKQTEAQQDIDSAQVKQLQELKARDREVRAHEAAHLAAAGAYAQGGPSFTYQRGTDGRQYAIGGEVQIDTTPIPGDPEATLKKAETLRRAALAPAQPSGQDRAIAAQATNMAINARTELTQQEARDREGIDRRGEVGREETLQDKIRASGAVEPSGELAAERLNLFA